MIYVVIEFAYVNFQAIPSARSIQNQSFVHILQTLVNATPFDTSIGVTNELRLPETSQHVYNAVVYYSVWKEWSNHKLPLFGIIDLSDLILPRYVRFISQHFIERLQIFHNALIEIIDLRSITFAFLGGVLRMHQICAGVDKVIHIFEFL